MSWAQFHQVPNFRQYSVLPEVSENDNFRLPNDDESGLNFSNEFINHLYHSNVGDGVLSDMFSSTLINDQIHGHDEMLSGNVEVSRFDMILEDEIDDVEVKCVKRNGKVPQCKNLIAERKRRKKLNERLYMLRSLVPTISKLDRASIIGDATDFIKELQKHTKELEEQLQQQSDNEYDQNSPYQFADGDDFTGRIRKQTEVEVKRIDETNNNGMFVKMLNEKKVYGFVKMLEVLDEQDLEVVSVNVTSFGTLMSSVFHVQGKEGSLGIVEAECVKERLLEIAKK